MDEFQCLFVGLVAHSFFVFNYFQFLFFSSIGRLCGAGVFGLIGCQYPSPGLALPIFFNNNHNIIITIFVFIIIIIIKRVRPCKAGESDIHPISTKTPAPQYNLQTERREIQK